MAAVLEIKQIDKRMGKKQVIQDVSFSVNEGEIFGFLGPNGAGKTTTIKMILGLLSVDKGEILINGVSIKEDAEKARSYIGGIIENPEMYSYLTGRTNLELYARMHEGVTKERINEVIQMVKLGNRIDDKVKKYSLGMRQRLGVAQAILHRPKLLILDEPTNGLDPVGIKELRDTLRHLAEEEGVAVLVSSHLLAEMELMCDTIGIIDNGKMGSVEKLTSFTEDRENQKVGCLFRVDDLVKAKTILAMQYPTLPVDIQQDQLLLHLEEKEIPQVNKALVLGDVAVSGIAEGKKSLEQAFIEATEGSKGQIL